MRVRKCRPDQHVDRPMRGGKRVKCITCGDVFPCRTACDHADCALAAGRPMPEGVYLAGQGPTDDDKPDEEARAAL